MEGTLNLGEVVDYQGLQIEVQEGVYPPGDDTYLLIDNLTVNPTDFVLEIGTGCGIIALIAAQTAIKVIATDISPIAIECAKNNVIRNRLDAKVELRQGNLFDPIDKSEKFDLILFNAPYLPDNTERTQNNSWLEKAWDGGKSGRKIIDPFIKKCKKYLKSFGRVQLIQSSLSNIQNSLDFFQRQGFQVKLSASKSFFFEKIVLLDAWLEKI